MLGKLYKYDIKCTARVLVPVYVIYLAITAALKVMLEMKIETGIFALIGDFLSMVFFLLSFCVFLLGWGHTLRRFNENLFTDEGYLMNTLPVKPWQHITAKLFASFSWVIISIVCIAAAFGILMIGKYEELKIIFEVLGRELSDFKAYETVMLILLVLSFGVFITLLTFAGDALKSAFGFMKKAYVQVIVLIVGFFIGMIGLPYFGEFIYAVFDDVFKLDESYGFVFLLSAYSLLFILLSVGMFALTNYLMKRKLNLE